ncbi:MAG: transketolase [Saprospiraceae bacterium]
MADIAQLKAVASQVRRDIVRQVANANSGHPGGSLGCADLLVALYFDSMTHHTDFRMEGHHEDMFYLSNGHISPLWYSVLARSGYFPVAELNTFRQLNSRLQGHPTTHEGLPGVRTASGSLGQGLSVAIGAALAKRLNNDPQLVFCLMGDGEQQEGQVWEAVMFAGHNKVDNLVAIVDRNNQQIDGSLDEVLGLGDLGAKYAAFGWEVLRMDGNNMEEVVATLRQARSLAGKGKPIMIDMKTEMGKGVDYMEGTHKWHGKAPDAALTARAMEQLAETLGDF